MAHAAAASRGAAVNASRVTVVNANRVTVNANRALPNRGIQRLGIPSRELPTTAIQRPGIRSRGNPGVAAIVTGNRRQRPISSCRRHRRQRPASPQSAGPNRGVRSEKPNRSPPIIRIFQRFCCARYAPAFDGLSRTFHGFPTREPVFTRCSFSPVNLPALILVIAAGQERRCSLLGTDQW